jgi:hypothetical protein
MPQRRWALSVGACHPFFVCLRPRSSRSIISKLIHQTTIALATQLLRRWLVAKAQQPARSGSEHKLDSFWSGKQPSECGSIGSAPDLRCHKQHWCTDGGNVMICSHCQTANPQGAKFCVNCGQALAVVCPNCNTTLPNGARFCSNCGHNLAATPSAPKPTAPAAERADRPSNSLHRFIPKELISKLESARASGGMEGERRVVTMLFADVKGSTAAASQLDPRDLHRRAPRRRIVAAIHVRRCRCDCAPLCGSAPTGARHALLCRPSIC